MDADQAGSSAGGGAGAGGSKRKASASALAAQEKRLKKVADLAAIGAQPAPARPEPPLWDQLAQYRADLERLTASREEGRRSLAHLERTRGRLLREVAEGDRLLAVARGAQEEVRKASVEALSAKKAADDELLMMHEAWDSAERTIDRLRGELLAAGPKAVQEFRDGPEFQMALGQAREGAVKQGWEACLGMLAQLCPDVGRYGLGFDEAIRDSDEEEEDDEEREEESE